MTEPADVPKRDDEGGPVYPTLDWLTPEVWPAEHRATLDVWQQGNLLPGSTISWAGMAGHDPVTDVEYLSTTPSDAGWFHVVAPDLTFDWMIVTSQTCDIAAEGPGAKHPFVQVSPVVRMDDASENQRSAIYGHEVSHLVALTKPPSEGFWVVDLRVSYPVSKHILHLCEPSHGFSDEQDLLEFAEHVGHKVRRPSLHDMISGDMTKSIGQHIKTVNKKKPEWWERVEQLRVLLTSSRLKPTSVQLVVVEQNELDADQREVWRQWASSFSKVLQAEGMAMEPIFFTTLDDMAARTYRDSVPLRVPELRRPHSW